MESADLRAKKADAMLVLVDTNTWSKMVRRIQREDKVYHFPPSRSLSIHILSTFDSLLANPSLTPHHGTKSNSIQVQANVGRGSAIRLSQSRTQGRIWRQWSKSLRGS